MSLLSDKQFLFIIGSPRSGTSWLQAMICAHPLVCSTVELRLFNGYTAPWIKAWEEEASNMAQGRWYQGLPFLWTEDEFYEFLRGFLEKVYERVVATNFQATHVLDKHPGYSVHVKDINMLFQAPRFIHMIRDGRDVAVSMVAARRQIGFGTGTIRDSAVAWKKHVRAAQKAKQYQNRYLEVRYEDLSNAGVSVLKSVFDFCGLSIPEDVAAIVNAHQFDKMKSNRSSPLNDIQAPQGHYRKGKVGSWRKELAPMQKYLFDEIAGNLLSELGYAENGWWAESRIQKLVLPLLAVALPVLRKSVSATMALTSSTQAQRIKESRICRLAMKKLEQ